MNILGPVISILLFTITSAVVQVTIIKDTEGYYWRDYKGEIPRDAVPGGLDKHGMTTYIGQVLHIFPPNGKLIPGTIDATKRKMYYAWGDNAYEVSINVKILCSQHPEQFEWLETDIPKAQSLSQQDLVLGGYDTSYPLFIGKIHFEGEVLVGKVTIPTPYDAVGFVANGKPYYVKTTFEILFFNSETINKVDSSFTKQAANITVYW